MAGRPRVMGIVNVTPDSFSDGGRYADTGTAVAHGLELLDQGADILDIGGESTRPGATRPLLAEELDRVVPVIRELASAGATVSVDRDGNAPFAVRQRQHHDDAVALLLLPLGDEERRAALVEPFDVGKAAWAQRFAVEEAVGAIARLIESKFGEST